jgi:hypothetical protein
VTSGSRARGRAALLAVAVTAGCASTRVTQAWSDPAAGTVTRLVVACDTHDSGVRRACEDAGARRLGVARAVAAHRLLGPDGAGELDTLKQRLRDAGYDGLLVLRLGGVGQRPRPVPYVSFGRYGDWSSPRLDRTTRTTTEPWAFVTATLYALADDRVIGTGTAATFAPRSAEQVFDEASRALARALLSPRPGG